MVTKNTSYQYVTTKEGGLYKGILASDFSDGVCVWDCYKLYNEAHAGFVGQGKSGLTSSLCDTCEAARAQIVALLQDRVLLKTK